MLGLDCNTGKLAEHTAGRTRSAGCPTVTTTPCAALLSRRNERRDLPPHPFDALHNVDPIGSGVTDAHRTDIGYPTKHDYDLAERHRFSLITPASPTQ